MRIALLSLALSLVVLGCATAEDVSGGVPRDSGGGGTEDVSVVEDTATTSDAPKSDASSATDAAKSDSTSGNDGGATDANGADTKTTDSGVADTGTTPADTGTAPVDTGTPPADTGTVTCGPDRFPYGPACTQNSDCPPCGSYDCCAFNPFNGSMLGCGRANGLLCEP